MPRLSRNKPRLFSGRSHALCILACALAFTALLALATEVQARTVRYLPISSIDFKIGLSYGKLSGNQYEGKTFRQNYSMSLKGYAIDPRLMTFDFSLGLEQQDNSGYYGNDFWAVRPGVRLSFFNGINRERGLKLWRYVPSPLVLRYDYTVTGEYNYTTYGLSMHYYRVGYIRFFSAGRIMYFDDGKKRASSDTNRYRLKYQNNSFNYNRNGNGNWNRNGNGNWNRNGNGNWNRNGNGNWNRNGNGNWNRNGNGNWNRNGNGNWDRNGNGIGNAGNWESGNRGFVESLKRKPSRPLGFRFPHINLDINHGDYESRLNSNQAFGYTMGNMRIDTTDSRPGRAGGGRYGSSYSLSHRFHNISGGVGWDNSSFVASNAWRHFRIRNHIGKTHGLEDEFRYELYSQYDNKYKATTYIINLGGKYIETDTVTSYEYGVSLSVLSGLTKRKRLTPKLVSTTDIGVNLGRENDKVKDGVKYSGRVLYSVTLKEKLEYFRFKSFHITADLTTSVSESGVPLRFALRGRTSGSRKWSYATSYNYHMYYPAAYGELTSYQSADGLLYYRINSSLSTSQGLNYSEQLRTFGEKDGATALKYNGTLNWRISSLSKMDLRLSHGRGDNSRTYGYIVRYNRQTGVAGNLSLVFQRNWDNLSDGKDDKALARYSWGFRQFGMALEYDYSNLKTGAETNEIWFKLNRKFNLRTRRLRR